jgi:hypothetical protein
MPQVTKADYSALSSLERDTLVAVGLTAGKPSGHDIWNTLIDNRPGSQRNSSFYNALESLVSGGLVEKRDELLSNDVDVLEFIENVAEGLWERETGATRPDALARERQTFGSEIYYDAVVMYDV